MTDSENLQIVRASYAAYAESDRAKIESLLAEDLMFFAPPDPGIDRGGYFARCWPNAGHAKSFELVRSFESGDEVVVTYEAERTDGTRFRNTEVFELRDGRIVRIEVYFGWDLVD